MPRKLPVNSSVARYLKTLGHRGGTARAAALTAEERSESASTAAKARKAALTPEQRSQIARKAAKARWKKK